LAVLRPADSLLGSSKAAIRANVRAERLKAVVHLARVLWAIVLAVFAVAVDLVLLWAMPFVYLVAAYLALDLPARWMSSREAYGGWGVVAFFASLAIGLVGVMRAVQNSEPIAPVRPEFAKTMLRLGWATAAVLTIGDLVF
jgi:hypothetical protein